MKIKFYVIIEMIEVTKDHWVAARVHKNTKKLE
jgi:hypothetical protein